MDKEKDIDINLLEKTELWVQGVSLRDARLDDLAQVVAKGLDLEPREVMVVDVRDDHIVMDILRPVLKAGQIAGKGKEILRNMAQIPGVTLTPEAAIHSEGALGWICLDAEDYEAALKKASRMGEEIRDRVSKRAVVFSTGFEVQQGLIADTNFPAIQERLQKEGYAVSFGGILADDQGAIAYRLGKALDEGFGLIITTGGVGAEDKDRTVEAVLRIVPEAATPYILKFKPGTGRHVKDGVRIAVGRTGLSRIVALPGPTREVRLGLDRFLEGLEKGWEEKQIADHIAAGLRETWRRHHE